MAVEYMLNEKLLSVSHKNITKTIMNTRKKQTNKDKVITSTSFELLFSTPALVG